MYKENDYVVYKKDVCKIKEIRKNKLNGTEYYIMVPIDDPSLIIDVPTDNRMGYIRSVITKDEAIKLIDSIKSITPLSNINDKSLENNYKELLANNTFEDLIKVIKTSYLRNETRLKNNKKISENDNKYFNLAEKFLYNELSIALNLSFNETKNYIIEKLS